LKSGIVDRFEKCKNDLISTGKAREGDFIGCTEEEINLLKQAQEVETLPQSYEIFLRSFGKSMGVFSAELELIFANLMGYKTYLKETVEENWTDLELRDNIFVFSDHLGYVFCFFDISDTPEQKVQSIIIGDKNERIMQEYFIDWFEEAVKAVIA
jgi:hypothetical protein